MLCSVIDGIKHLNLRMLWMLKNHRLKYWSIQGLIENTAVRKDGVITNGRDFKTGLETVSRKAS